MCTMYCVRLTDVLLLFTTFFFFVNLFIDCQRCNSEMTYHRHSQTCLVVVNLNKTHKNAERYCADTYSGGHLVYILDSETNNFTNSLLRENEFYHIGLSDKINNGDYRWTNGQTANYTNFKTGSTPKFNHYYILMYNSVWYEYYNLKAKFICQKSADCQLCEAGMTYHRHTHSCMIAVNSFLHYEDANKYCAKTYSGGHLVYILDEETDTFIKWNITADWIYGYYIGLSDKEENGVYKWINGQNVSYTDWSRENHTPDTDRDYVVASWYGWYEVFDEPRKFICQSVADCQLCEAGMTYHRHSHSCMIAVNSYLHYEEANKYCAKTYSGGHLVYILDNETDTFIKRKLAADMFYRYYIGLSDKQENGVYKWINGQNVSYTNWFGENYTPDTDRDYVVASRYGWVEVYDERYKFICQSVAAISLSFSLNHHDFVNSTREVTALTTNTLRCEVDDIDDHHLQLLYHNSDGTVSKIEEKRGKNLTYTFWPGFNSSGVYVCQIGQQKEGEIVSLTGTLKVISPPKCPNNLTSEELDQNTVRLTWSPITYEISEQLFLIFKADRLGDVHVDTVSDKKKMFLSFNVTGLSPNTTYSFYLHVKAGQFEIPCKHVITSVLIKDKPDDTTIILGDTASPSTESENLEAFLIATVVMASVAASFTISTVIACYRYHSIKKKRLKDNYDELDTRITDRMVYHRPQVNAQNSSSSCASGYLDVVSSRSSSPRDSPAEAGTDANPYAEIGEMCMAGESKTADE